MSLTAKQECFVKEYLIDLNATQAAIRAGYSEKTAGQIGDENLKKPQISEAIQKAMDARAQRTEITADYVLNGIKSIIERCTTPHVYIDEDGVERTKQNFEPSHALKGFELLGKHLKLFTDKTEITGKDGEPISIEDATVRASRVAALIAQANARKDEAEPTAE